MKIRLIYNEEEIPAPTNEVIILSNQVIRLAEELNLPIVEMDEDVMGGLAIYLGAGDKIVWIALMNIGANTVVWSRDGKVIGHEMLDLDNAESSDWVKFLIEE